MSPFGTAFPNYFVTPTNPFLLSGPFVEYQVTHSLNNPSEPDVAQQGPLNNPEFSSSSTVTSANNPQDPDATHVGNRTGSFASTSAAAVNRAAMAPTTETMTTTTTCQTNIEIAIPEKNMDGGGDGDGCGVFIKEMENGMMDGAWDPASVYVAPGVPPPTPAMVSRDAYNDQAPLVAEGGFERLSESLVLMNLQERIHEHVSLIIDRNEISTPPSSPPIALAIEANNDAKDANNHDGNQDNNPMRTSSSSILTITDKPITSPSRLLPTPPTTPKKGPALSIQGFTIRMSPTGGLGAFATRALRRGELILEESPLFIARRGAIFRMFAKLDDKTQKRALGLHASSHFKPGTPRLEAVWDTNSFATGINREAGLFPVAARFNHACAPANNIDFEYNKSTELLRFWVGVDEIAVGDELKICYGVSKTPDVLYRWYGFRCACGSCNGLSDEEIDRFSVKW